MAFIMSQITIPTVPGGYARIEPEHRREKRLDVADEPIRELMKTSGAILSRGFKPTKWNFRKIGKRLFSVFVINESGGRTTISLDKRVQSSDTPTSHLFLRRNFLIDHRGPLQAADQRISRC